MKKLRLAKYLSIGIAVIGMQSCFKGDDSGGNDEYEEVVAVANRGAGSVTFVNAETNAVIEDLEIAGSEPMYVIYVPAQDKVYVGDRAQNYVHVIDPDTRKVTNSIAVGDGVFHMWADGRGNRLWVNNDVGNTTSVIDLNTEKVVYTIDIPERPHDVFLDRTGERAYISLLLADANVPDKVLMYDANTFELTAEAEVGKDPHLYHIPAQEGQSEGHLYVPCQSGDLFVLDEDGLDFDSNTPFEGAHGVFPSPDLSTLFVTNLPGGQIFSIDVTNSLMPTLNGSAFDTSIGIPHNVVTNRSGNKLFVTHSGGMAVNLSIYYIDEDQLLTVDEIIETGTNPFGLAYYHRELD